MGVFERFRLDGKRFLITGGSRGLGKEMALAFAEAGADGVLVGRDHEALETTADALRALGCDAAIVTADVGEPRECEALCEEMVENHPPIDILVNNVGGRCIDVATEDLPLAEWQRIIDLNLTSTFICTKVLGGAMVRRGNGGRVINNASISGLIANRGIGGRSYETSKAAVIQFTRAVAVDWAPHGVTVNAICPGGFLTAPNRRWAHEKPEVIAEFEAQIPMGRLGEPRDIGPLALYLASDASSYVTGSNFVIDGGYTAW